MRLGHGGLGAVDAVADQPPKERAAHLAGGIRAELTLPVSPVDHVLPLFAGGQIDELAQLDVTVCAGDEHPAIAPVAQAVWREPVYPKIPAHAVGGGGGTFAEILKLRRGGVGVVGLAGKGDVDILDPGKVEKLFQLVTADIAQNAAVPRFLVKPGRARAAQAVWAEALNVQHTANRVLFDKIGVQFIMVKTSDFPQMTLINDFCFIFGNHCTSSNKVCAVF